MLNVSEGHFVSRPLEEQNPRPNNPFPSPPVLWPKSPV